MSGNTIAELSDLFNRIFRDSFHPTVEIDGNLYLSENGKPIEPYYKEDPVPRLLRVLYFEEDV